MSLFPFKALNSHHFNYTFEVLIQERKGGSDSASSSAWMPFGEPQDDVLICFGFVAAKPCKNYNSNNHLQVPLWRTSGKPILQAHYISLIFFSYMGCIFTLGMRLTHIYPSVVSWAFWQDLPVRLLMHISCYSIDTLQEQAKIWVLSNSESADRQGVWAITEPHRALKDVKYSVIADSSQGILLEVELCFLQSPQHSHQHTTLHHRAGIGPWNLVRQGVHHWQSERESG